MYLFDAFPYPVSEMAEFRDKRQLITYIVSSHTNYPH